MQVVFFFLLVINDKCASVQGRSRFIYAYRREEKKSRRRRNIELDCQNGNENMPFKKIECEFLVE